MPPTRRPRVRRLNGVSRLWLLALAVLVPGTVLAAIGVRSVQQERAAAVQALRERLDATADRARAGLERELARWDAFAADAARLGPTWAEPALGQVDLPRSGTRGGPVLIFQSRDRLITVPTDAVLYDPPSAPAAAPPVLPEALRAAEAIELQVPSNSGAVGKTLTEIGLPKLAIVGGIVRGQKGLVPHGDTVIEGEDRVIAIALPEAIPALEKLFS